jgi:DNA-binding MarR family transcriptional regulator
MPPQFLDTEAAFALRAKQLVDRLYDQMAEALIERGLKIISKTMGIVQLLYSEGAQSQAQIADRLKYSHQLTAQRLAWLYDNEVVVSERDPSDARRRLVQLTPAGIEEGKKLQAFLPELIDAYDALFEEIGIDLDAAIQKADCALEQTPLKERMALPQNENHRAGGVM